MPNYRRAFVSGGTWFFTVNLLQRHGNDLLVREIELLRHVVKTCDNANGYDHVNPLKHGLVKRVRDWPYSTFHRHVEDGIYALDWCGDVEHEVGGDI